MLAAPVPKTLEEHNIFKMQMRRSSGELPLELTDEEYSKLGESKDEGNLRRYNVVL